MDANHDADPHEAEAQLLGAMTEVAEATHGLEPVPGAIRKEQLAPLHDGLAKITDACERMDEVIEADGVASIYARCAALAIAAGDEAAAHRWLLDGERFVPDEYRAQFAAGREHPERFRVLAHGRMKARMGDAAAARKIWGGISTGTDAIAEAARAEIAASRARLTGTPTLWTFNGFGLRFAGERDHGPNATYTTTHCLTALFIPVFPLGAYRVQRYGDSWAVLAREPLSPFARMMRYVAVAALVLLVAGIGVYEHYSDPDRRARLRYEETLAAASALPPEPAIARLEPLLSGEDADRVGPVRVQRAAAEILKKTAALAPRPFLREHVDHGARLVQRYRNFPEAARRGASREAAIDALEGWRTELGTTAESAVERLALLRLAVEVADGPRAQGLLRQLTALRLAVADAKVADWPLDALAILVDPLQAESMQRATKIVAGLVESPSLLVDAGAPLDKWLAVAAESDVLRQAVISQREAAIAGKAAAESAGAAQLAAMEKERPWDQFVQLRLAGVDIEAGKLAAAASRLEKIGPPGRIVRDGQLMLAQLASELGKLEQADALLTQLLAHRLPAFLAASSAFERLARTAEERLWQQLRAGDIPMDLDGELALVNGDEAKSRVATEWVQKKIMADAAFQEARERFLATGDVVPVALAAGSVKLRRAQAMSGAERGAMLGEAERAFLAIRSAAEGQPEYQLGLGEIYARLGKTKESDAAFGAVLERKDPKLSLEVARTYRNLGNTERAKQIATAVYDSAPTVATPTARFLALLEFDRGDDDAAETWLLKLKAADPSVRTELAAIEGRRLMRQGKWAECAAKFAQVAKWHLEAAEPVYNNAAIAHGQRFRCSGELGAHADAEAAFARAYRAQPEHPIVVGNFISALAVHGELRALSREIDVGALRARNGEILELLRDGPERDALDAAVLADPRMQRAIALQPQHEVLAPNRIEPYLFAFGVAHKRRDDAAALAILERARRAKLDTSDYVASREKRASGADDASERQQIEADIARYDGALARQLDGRFERKTRAVAMIARAGAREQLGHVTADGALFARARAEALEAAKLWPAVDARGLLIASFIDEAAVAADAAAWRTLRRERSAIAALAKLVADGAPLAAKIRGSQQWAAVLEHARSDPGRPTLDDLRLARLLGDAALEARAKPVLDDKRTRAGYELAALADPSGPAAAEALADLDRR